MNQISDRLRGLVQSDIRRMSRECERVGGINLGQGICDLPTIPELVEGACDAIASKKATYSKFEGIDILLGGARRQGVPLHVQLRGGQQLAQRIALAPILRSLDLVDQALRDGR